MMGLDIWSWIKALSLASKLFVTVTGGLIVTVIGYLIKLGIDEFRNRTDFKIDIALEDEGTGFAMSGGHGGTINFSVIQSYVRIKLLHIGRRDTAEVKSVKAKLYRPWWPLALGKFAPSAKIIDGKQPFSQGERIVIQINSKDIIDYVESVTARENIKLRFMIEESVSQQTFCTDKFEFSLSEIRKRDPSSSRT